MSFDMFKKTMERTTTTILQKTGAVDKTLDKEFEEQERKIKGVEMKTTSIFKEGKHYLDALRGMNLAQMKIADFVTNFYDESATLGLCSLKYKDSIELIDGWTKQQTDLNFRTTVLEPIDRYNSIFPDIQEAVKKRNTKLLDYDSLRSKVKKLTEKPSEDASKLPRAEKECQIAKEDFEKSNNVIKEEIPKFIDARVAYFDVSFEALLKTQLDYYHKCYECLVPLQKYFGAEHGGDLNAKVQDALQRMRDLTIVKAQATNKRMSVAN